MCLHCAAGFHNECELPTASADTWSCCCPPEIELLSSVRGGPTKENDEVTDVESTGRKRAAIAFPIEVGKTVCEWKGLRFAGGGVSPIIGCHNNLATDRHHGPDKSTLNNSENNVHRVCASCHNRWHTKNDNYYGNRPPNGQPFLPREGTYKEHDAETKATLKEILDNEVSWSLRDKKSREEAGSSAGDITEQPDEYVLEEETEGQEV